MDLSAYPTTLLQQFGFFIIFFFPTVSLLVVSLRVYDRILTKNFGWDDIFIIAAVVTAAVEAGFTYVMMKLQYIGVHQDQIPVASSASQRAYIVNYVVVMFYNPELALVKSSILFFLLRLGGHNVRLRWAIYVLNVINIALLVSVFTASVFTCVPVQKYWNTSLAGDCNNEALQYLITSSITVVTDILVMIIPVKLVVGLQMNTRTKMGLISVLCAGTLVIVFSILRLSSLANLYYGNPSADPTYKIDFVYSTIECNLAIISASVPPLYGMLKRWFPRMFPTVNGSSARTSSRRLDGVGEAGSYALKTIGGSAMGAKGLAGLSSGRSAHVRVGSLTASEAEILGRDGIVKTTQFETTYHSD